MKFPPGQGRFDDIGDIHGTVAAVHQHLQLIHKEDDPGTVFDRFNDIPQTFFQFPPVLGPRNHIAQFQGKNNLIREKLRSLPVYNPLGQAFRNRCFPHAGFPDQDRVVLSTPAQDPHYVLQFLFPAQHRIQLILCGQFVQIAPEAFQKF